MANEIDINENDLLQRYPDVLQTLLRDHSRFNNLRDQLCRASKTHTVTFLSIGKCQSEEEAIAIFKYIQT